MGKQVHFHSLNDAIGGRGIKNTGSIHSVKPHEQGGCLGKCMFITVSGEQQIRSLFLYI